VNCHQLEQPVMYTSTSWPQQFIQHITASFTAQLQHIHIMSTSPDA